MGELQVIEKIEKTPILTSVDIAKFCEEEGVTVSSVCKVLADGLKSDLPAKFDNSKIRYADNEPDMPTRHKYMTSALEVLRMVKKESLVVDNRQININVGNDEIVVLLHMVKDVASQLAAIRTSGQQTGEIIDVGTV